MNFRAGRKSLLGLQCGSQVGVRIWTQVPQPHKTGSFKFGPSPSSPTARCHPPSYVVEAGDSRSVLICLWDQAGSMKCSPIPIMLPPPKHTYSTPSPNVPYYPGTHTFQPTWEPGTISHHPPTHLPHSKLKGPLSVATLWSLGQLCLGWRRWRKQTPPILRVWKPHVPSHLRSLTWNAIPPSNWLIASGCW